MHMLIKYLHKKEGAQLAHFCKLPASGTPLLEVGLRVFILSYLQGLDLEPACIRGETNQ